MTFLERLWRGDVPHPKVVLGAIALGIVLYALSSFFFGLKSAAPLGLIYFWYLVVWMVVIAALVVVVRSFALRYAASPYRGVLLAGLALLAIPTLALPMAQLYAHYLQQEMDNAKAIIAIQKAKLPHSGLSQAVQSLQSKEDIQTEDTSYQDSVKRYQELKEQRDKARQQ